MCKNNIKQTENFEFILFSAKSDFFFYVVRLMNRAKKKKKTEFIVM